MACKRLPSLDSPCHTTRHVLALLWRGPHHRQSARRHRTQDNDATEECPATGDLTDKHQDPDGIQHRFQDGNQDGCVANFAQQVVKGQLPLSVGGLGGQGVEQFGRSEALVSLLDHQLPFLDHVHEFDADERCLCRVKGFEP
jgi:hypothetical protein